MAISAFDLTKDEQTITPEEGELTYNYDKKSSPYRSLIDAAEAQHGLPKNLLPRLLQQESNFNPKAKSPKGAEGIAQIMRSQHPTVKNPNDPNEAIPYSASYLKQLYNKFGDWSKAVAAYNTGPGNVAAGNIPPETIDYTNKVYGKAPSTNLGGVSAFDLGAEPQTIKPTTKPQIVTAQPNIYQVSKNVQYNELGQPISVNGVPYAITGPSGAGISNASMLFPISIRSAADIYQQKKINSLVSPTNPKGEAISNAPITNEKLSASQPQSWWQWFRSWVQVPEVGKDKAAIVGGLQRQTGMSARDILTHYDDMTNEVVGRSDTTSLYKMGKRGVEAGMMAGIATGLVSNPVPTLMGLGVFLGMDELINLGVSQAKNLPYQPRGGLGISDLLEAQGFSRDAIEALTFMGEVAAGAGVTKMGRGIIGKSISKATDKVSAFNDLIDRTKKSGIEDPTTVATKDLKTELVKDDLTQTGTKVQQVKGTLASDIERAQAKLDELAYNRTALEAGQAQMKMNKEIVSKNIAEAKAAEISAKSALDLGKEEGAPVPTQKVEPKVEPKVEEPAAEVKVPEIPVSDLTEENIVKYLKDNGYGEKDAVSIAQSDLASKETGMLTHDVEGERKPVTNMAEYDKQFKEFEAEGTEEIPKRDEPYTEVDEQTGEPIPEGLLDESSPFRNTDSKATAAMSKAFAEKMNAVRQSPEMLTQYFLNEFNRHLNGEEVDFVKARDSLSELAVRSDEARGAFDTDAEHAMWRDTVQDAAAWARRTDRSKIESTPEPGIRLNLGIPLDEIPRAVRQVVERIKGIPIRAVLGTELYRNTKIWRETGFWLGKDGRWRYELDDSKVKIEIPVARVVGETAPLGEVVKGLDKAFSAVPGLQDVKVKYNPGMNSSGNYDSLGRIINVRDLRDKSTIIHEVQHAINEITGGEHPFLGSSVSKEALRINLEKVDDLLVRMRAAAKTDTVKAMIDEVADTYKRAATLDNPNTAVLDHFFGELLPKIKDAEPDLLSRSSPDPSIVPDTGEPYKRYMTNQGEMEARLAEARMDFSAKERAAIPPWETLDRMLEVESTSQSITDISNKTIKEVVDKLNEYTKAGQKLYSGVPLDKLYTDTIEKIKRLGNITFNKGAPKYLGSGPVHGTDVDMLPSILKEGLRPGSAIDLKGDWMEDYPVIVSVPEAIKGKYVEHNKYYESANTARPTKITVDLDQYIPSKIDEIRSQIADLAKENPGVKFQILNDPGKAYAPKYSVENLTDLYTKATEIYKKGTPEIDKLRAEQDAIRQPFMTDKGYWKNISRDARKRLDAIDEEIKVLERQRRVETSRIESKIRDAEKDVELTEGEKFYSGLPLDEMARSILKKGREFSDSVDADIASSKIKFRDVAKNVKKLLIRGAIERSGNIRQALIDNLGDEGYKIVETMYLQAGAHPKAVNMLRQAKKEVWGGLPKDEKLILDKLTLAMRMIDIGNYKLPKNFTFPKGKSPEQSIIFKELFAHKDTNGVKDLSSEKAADIKRRADAFYEWMRKPVDDALEEGLITQKERDDLVSHNYRRIRSVEDVFDRSATPILGGVKTSVSDSGIQRLKKGTATDVYEASSEIMALETFNRLYGRIYRNRANREGLSLARTDPENPFFRVKYKKEELTSRAADLRSRLVVEGEPPNIVDAAVNNLLENKIPPDFAVNRVKVYENGKPINLFLSPDMAQEWITSNAQLTYKYAQVIRWLTGAPLVRTFATGINWAFALRNLPRDMMQIWFTARTFRDGKYESVYSPTIPIAATQMTADMVRVFRDAVLKKGKYNDYIDDGGGMDLLTTQGRMFRKGKHLDSGVDKFYDFMGYPGNTSETMTRLMTRDRVIINEAKRRGISYEEAAKDKDIRRMATFAARDYMDFHQGGDIAKALDTGLPYLNARLVASRGMARAMFKDQKLVTAYKIAQFGALITGLYIGNQHLHPQTMEALKGDQRTQGNLVFPLGDKFSFEDSKGQTRYPFFVLPIDQGMTFFKTVFEGATDLWLGNPIDVDRITTSLKNSSPVDTTPMPPTMSGAFGYLYNKDFWQNKDIRKQGEIFNYQLPKLFTGKELGGSEEEYTPGKTPQALIDTGKVTGLSPERLKYLAGQLVTNDNIFGEILGKGYESAFGQLPKKEREMVLAETLAKVPIVRSFFKITNPYSRYAQTISKSEEMSEVKRFTENRGLDVRAEGYLFDHNYDKSDVVAYMKSFNDLDTYDRLKKRFDFQVKTQNLDNRSFWLRLEGLGTEARARAYVEEFDNASPSHLADLMSQQSKVHAIGGFFTDDFRKEVQKVRRGQ